MNIEHSVLMNEFISFWFETSIDGVVLYETHIDFLAKEWTTWQHNRAGEEAAKLVSGTLDKHSSEDDMVEALKSLVEDAIQRKAKGTKG